MDATSFFVVVPFYNEAAGIEATLESLARQVDREFSLVLVDNASTDGGAAVALRFACRHPELAVHLIREPQKGTGAAADTGFRYAIHHGARWIARTDADCLPRMDWVLNIKQAFRDDGLELVAGKIKPRTDDIPLSWRDRCILPVIVRVAENFGKIHRRGPQFQYRYMLVAGNNMAITSDMYERAGGFPRSKIEDEHEDRTLSERVRTLTTRARVKRHVVVYSSIRRARRYGYLNTLLWYWDHRYQPKEVDVRGTKAHMRNAPCGSWRRALLHELCIYLASHPFALALAEIVRLLGPVVHLPFVGSIINDPVLAHAILGDARFTKSGPGSSGAIITQVMGDAALLNQDGSAHRTMRGRLSDLFGPAYLKSEIDPLLRDEMMQLRRALLAGQTVDLVAVMHRLTGRLTCHMLGITPDPASAANTYRTISALGSRMLAVMRLTTHRLTRARRDEARCSFVRLTELARPAFEAEDGASGGLAHRLRDLGLSFDEARGILAVLFLVGTETISTAVPRIVALLLDSGSFATLRLRRDLLPTAIDEGLRFVVPSPIMLRSPTEHVTVDGHRFRANRRVLLFTYNLLKHPRFTPQPRRFMIERRQDPQVKNLWFGSGPHFCLGYALAKCEIEAAIETLLDVPGDLRIVGRRSARRVMLPAYSHLYLRVEP